MPYGVQYTTYTYPINIYEHIIDVNVMSYLLKKVLGHIICDNNNTIIHIYNLFIEIMCTSG